MYQFNFNFEQFMLDYWQQKPTIIRQGFSNFDDPISAEELAGLSLEEEIDSRFISNHDHNWKVEHGPFDESFFGELAESHWQLVVQAANHWHPGAAQLVEPFKQLPQWLFDDVMVCFSSPQGGVGPHIDQYDVFIIQGQGQRRWRVGPKDMGQYQETIKANALKQIKSFEAEIDDVLEPGDILYIPAGFPHEGHTLTPSLSYSIGYRSPKEQELLSNFADYVLAHDLGDVHLHAPDMKAQQSFGEIKQEHLAKLTTMLKAATEDDDLLREFVGSMLSQSRHMLNIVPEEDESSEQEIQQYLFQGSELHKVAGLKTLYHDTHPTVAYINGERFDVSEEIQSQLSLLCNLEHYNRHHLPQAPTAEHWQLLTTLVNKGYWYMDEL